MGCEDGQSILHHRRRTKGYNMRIKLRGNTAHLYDLELIDRVAMRSQYRRLRMAMYAPQSSPYAAHGMYQGCYGMNTDEAKLFLYKFYHEISMSTYEGSK